MAAEDNWPSVGVTGATEAEVHNDSSILDIQDKAGTDVLHWNLERQHKD